ncbi:MAG: threonylcarbamoyl-AMP synthase [Burkholderiales bacterium]|nr:MAG: threonylcarbamoyl-AMP synthase [Burkholderiales bacterium]
MLEREIARAVDILRAGGLVAFPTETVYGLGADARNPDAVGKIFAAKGRPQTHPVIVHLGQAAQLDAWAVEISAGARRLAERFWPGPLTLILRRGPGVPDAVTGGQDTVGLRVPAHPVAQALLKAFGGGIAAPSANRFGRLSPTTAQHVEAELDGAVDLILDGGACPVGIESTIVDCSSERPTLLRPGHVTREALEETLGMTVEAPGPGSPRAPGRLPAHYAPATPLALVDSSALVGLPTRTSATERVAVLARSDPPPDAPHLVWVKAPEDPAGFARELYAHLRQLDRAGCSVILVEKPPPAPEWDAVLDRLTRAAAGSPPQAA